MALGYRTDLWTTWRVAEVIRRHLGVRYHPNHVRRLLVGLGWSYQKPERRARERDEAAIERWKRVRWPAVKKLRRLGAHLAFLDESGFLLIPHVRKTWAPRGQTPILRHRYAHDRLSAIPALTVSPRRRHPALYVQFHPTNIRSPEVVAFLQHLLRHLRGPIVLLWDDSRPHKSHLVERFLDRHPRLPVERFPGYAPELNPDEFVWTQLKRAVANATPDNLSDLGTLLLREILRTRRSQPLLAACITASKLPWRP